MSEPRIVRLRSLVWATLATGAVVTAVLVAIGVAALASSPALGIAAFVLAGAAVFATVRGTRVGAVLHDDGVDLRGPWSTKSLRWDEIERFSAGPVERLRMAGVAELRDGSRLRVHGVSAPGRFVDPSGESIRPLVEELNRALDAGRARG